MPDTWNLGNRGPSAAGVNGAPNGNTNGTGRTREPSTVAQLAAAKHLPEAFLREQGVEDIDGGGISVPYFDEAGEPLFTRSRGVPGGPRFKQPAGVRLVPYGLWRLGDRGQSVELALSEGESDAWTLWHHRVSALGLPGSNTAGCLQAEHLVGVERLYVVPDNDAAGKAFVGQVSERLGEVGYAGKALVVEVPRGFKDISDVHAGDPAGFPSRWRQLLAQARPLLVPGRRHQANGKRSSVGSVGCRVDVVVPRGMRPFVPFPVDALPRPVSCFVGEAAAALNCDPCYIALPALAVVAGAIGNSRSIQLKQSWYEPAIVWSALVAESGTLKTPAFKLALGPVYKVQRRFRQEHAKALARHEAEGSELTRADRPAPPVMRRAYCSDATIEALVRHLEDNPKGLLVARDELSGWLGSFMKYKAKGAGSDLPNWLELFSAGNVTVDRRTGDRPNIYVEHAAASVAGTIQPGVLGRILTTEHYESGLAARVLLAWPPRRAKEWTEAEVSEGAGGAYERLVEQLHALTMRQTSESRFVPHRRRLSAEAKEAWVAFYADFAREQAEAEGDLAAALSKLEGYAARFALIHHVVTHVGLDTHDDRDVGACSVEAGVTLARWFANEARRVYAALKESDVEKQTRRLMDWIRSRGEEGVTARDLQRSNPARYPRSEDAEAALEALVEAGAGRWEERPTTDRGGQPTRRFHLNPTPDSTDTTPSAEEDP